MVRRTWNPISSETLAAVVTAIVCMYAAIGVAADWPGFRGPAGAAVSDETSLPTTWSDTENLAWKTELPGPGSSSPVTWKDRVFVTCYTGYGLDRENPGNQDDLSRVLVCLNLENGQILWQTPVKARLPEDPYSGFITEHGYASSTPATDGERVYVFYGKSGALAFDMEGHQLWQTDVGTGSAFMAWGSGTSPLLYKDLVILNANAESNSIVALNKSSGEKVWESPADAATASWSTPILATTAEGKQELVLNVPYELWGMDPDTGKLLWFVTAV